MPAEVTDPLTQLLSWGMWLGAAYMIAKAIQWAPTMVEEWRRAERGHSSHFVARWLTGAVVLAVAGTLAQVILA